MQWPMAPRKNTVLQKHYPYFFLFRCTVKVCIILCCAKLTSGRYLLGQSVGGVVFPPYSEVFGRKWLYIGCSGLYTIFCALVAAVPSLAAVVVSRFVCGLLSAIPTVVVLGSMEDMFNAKDRVWTIYFWSTAGIY